MLNQKAYEILRWVVIIVLPAIGTFSPLWPTPGAGTCLWTLFSRVSLRLVCSLVPYLAFPRSLTITKKSNARLPQIDHY